MGLELTVDEIVNTLKRSSLTTVLVEGKDDIMIYRWLEEELGIEKANFFPCHGRDNLLKVFDRRSEFSHIKTVFVADKDAYIYTSIPEEYGDIIFTNGYSIENDLYFGRKIENLFSAKEKVNFLLSLNSFIEYYAFEIDKLLSGKECTFRNHPQNIICEKSNKVKEEFLKEINFSQPRQETISKLNSDYDILIRGKSLFALLTRILSNSKRAVKHSKLSLLENCYRVYKSQKFEELIKKIDEKICA